MDDPNNTPRVKRKRPKNAKRKNSPKLQKQPPKPAAPVSSTEEAHALEREHGRFLKLPRRLRSKQKRKGGV
jgi:hypothetical protein